MGSKRIKLFQGGFFHIFNKSIANYHIYREDSANCRFLENLEYYNNPDNIISYSLLIRYKKVFKPKGLLSFDKNNICKVIAYSLLPDHYHLVIKVLKEQISSYISKVENSFTRYFNEANNRKGPLWQSRFKAVLIKSNEQLLHVVRYVHLNPTTSFLVKKPKDWQFSSYREYLGNKKFLKEINEISIRSISNFKKFTESNIDYQRKLKLIKKLLLE